MATTLIRLIKPFIGKPKADFTPAFTRLPDDKKLERINELMLDLRSARADIEARIRARHIHDDHAQAAMIARRATH